MSPTPAAARTGAARLAAAGARSAARVGAPAHRPTGPRRISGPARRAHGPAGPAQPVEQPRVARPASPAPFTQHVARVVDHSLLDRLIRGRAWIGLVAFALIGIVAMQVTLLKLNAGIGSSILRATALQRESSLLTAQVAGLSAAQRVQTEATRLGMVYVPPADVRYLRASSGDASRAAASYVAPASGSTASTGTGSTSGTPTGTGVAASTPESATGADVSASTSGTASGVGVSASTESTTGTGASAPSDSTSPTDSSGSTVATGPSGSPDSTGGASSAGGTPSSSGVPGPAAAGQ
jgi:hypothetical protein